MSAPGLLFLESWNNVTRFSVSWYIKNAVTQNHATRRRELSSPLSFESSNLPMLFQYKFRNKRKFHVVQVNNPNFRNKHIDPKFKPWRAITNLTNNLSLILQNLRSKLIKIVVWRLKSTQHECRHCKAYSNYQKLQSFYFLLGQGTINKQKQKSLCAKGWYGQRRSTYQKPVREIRERGWKGEESRRKVGFCLRNRDNGRSHRRCCPRWTWRRTQSSGIERRRLSPWRYSLPILPSFPSPSLSSLRLPQGPRQDTQTSYGEFYRV